MVNQVRRVHQSFVIRVMGIAAWWTACVTTALFASAGDKLHWSQTEPFGHNVPQGLRTDTLDDVRGELAAAGLVVERGPTQVILRQRQIGERSFVGTLVKFPDGHIHVSAAEQQRRSADAGRTWKNIKSNFTNYACRTKDGQAIQFSGRAADGGGLNREPADRHETIKIRAELLRSHDSGLTETSEEATIYLPTALKRMTLRHARIVQLTDGSLLACSYVSFQQDPWVTKTGIVHAKTFQKNRVIVIRSTDEGKTWNYHSTVAFDVTDHVQDRILGFSEPDMVALRSGEVLVFMRTVAGGGVRPMYMSLSRDGGQGWTDAEPVTDRGAQSLCDSNAERRHRCHLRPPRKLADVQHGPRPDLDRPLSVLHGPQIVGRLEPVYP